MSKNLNDVLAMLPHLRQKDLSTVRAAIDHLLDKRVENDPTLPLFGAIKSILGIHTSFHQFQAARAYAAWKRAAPAYVQFLDATWPEASKVAKVAITTVLIDMLADDLAGMKVPVTLNSIVTNLERIPQLFDREFPGYRKMGMAHLVLAAMEKEKKDAV